LTLPNENITLYVINLTKKSAHLVASVSIAKAVQALNDQIENDFAPIWGATGTLVDATGEFTQHLTKTQGKDLISANPFEVSAALVDYIVQHNNNNTVNWKTSGILYLTDEGAQGFGGVHVDEKVAAFDIPYALVVISDTNWTIPLSHETLELLADPWGMRWIQQSHYAIQNWPTQNWIIEVCDACEDASYPGSTGVPVSDFVVPEYFTVATQVDTPLDFLQKLFRNTSDQPIGQFPYPMLQGGYLSFINPTTNQFSQITWFDNGPQPIYTAPQDDSGSSQAKLGNSHHHCSRLTKYLHNHRHRHSALFAYRMGRLAQMGK